MPHPLQTNVDLCFIPSDLCSCDLTTNQGNNLSLTAIAILRSMLSKRAPNSESWILGTRNPQNHQKGCLPKLLFWFTGRLPKPIFQRTLGQWQSHASQDCSYVLDIIEAITFTFHVYCIEIKSFPIHLTTPIHIDSNMSCPLGIGLCWIMGSLKPSIPKHPTVNARSTLAMAVSLTNVSLDFFSFSLALNLVSPVFTSCMLQEPYQSGCYIDELTCLVATLNAEGLVQNKLYIAFLDGVSISNNKQLQGPFDLTCVRVRAVITYKQIINRLDNKYLHLQYHHVLYNHNLHTSPWCNRVQQLKAQYLEPNKLCACVVWIQQMKSNSLSLSRRTTIVTCIFWKLICIFMNAIRT